MTTAATPVVWLDTNVIFRYLLNDHDDHSPEAAALVKKAERGQIRLRLSMVIAMECSDTMRHAMRIDKQDISKAMLKFMDLDGVETEEKTVMVEAFARFGQERQVDFVDAYLAAYAKTKKPAHIVTFNAKDFRVNKLTVSRPDEL